jgi:TRAP-type C4-dicarboxylate transport system permease small subunit
VRTGIHGGVDVLVNRLSTAWRNKFIIFGLLAGAAFTGVVGTLGIKCVYALSCTGSTSEVLEIPMWIVYLAVPLASYLMCFRFLQVAWAFNLYVVSGITKMGISELTIAVLPWLLKMPGFPLVVTYIPQISLWLPDLVYGH